MHRCSIVVSSLVQRVEWQKAKPDVAAAACCAVLCRSNAVRMLCQIVDSQLLAQIERYLKQAVADKSPVVAASVLVSALHLMHNVRLLSLGILDVLAGGGWNGAGRNMGCGG